MTYPTQEFLQECFSYDPETGIVLWKVRPASHFKNPGICKAMNNRQAGAQAGYLRTDGYRVVTFGTKQYNLHRLIFILMTGACPKFGDHINGVRNDNRWCNLRDVSRSQNVMNAKVKANNRCGHTNIHWAWQFDRWVVQLRAKGREKLVSYHKNLEDAIAWRDANRDAYYGEFYRKEAA